MDQNIFQSQPFLHGAFLQTAFQRSFGKKYRTNAAKKWIFELEKKFQLPDLKFVKDFSAYEECSVIDGGTRFSTHYLEHVVPDGESLPPRFLGQYHFVNEWNNFGYGRIKTDNSFFGLSVLAKENPQLKPLQILKNHKKESLGTVSAIVDDQNTSAIWFSRPVGPVDGFDWFLVERFFSDYRAQELECTPVIKEIPWGYDSACTMRIDCDEAIASGRALFELYKKHNLPFGLAIKTQQEIGKEDIRLMRDVIQAKGTVVTHSHTHASNWGGSTDTAMREVQESQKILRSLGVEGINYRYAVSPFHQNSQAAIQGLKDAGIEMFVSGIIANDPEFLMARAGQVPFVEGIYSHSQQCMLHGECYHQSGNSWEQYKHAFELAKSTETFFGYLDHPFSSYKYGWNNETERLDVHEEFIRFILKHKVWWTSLERALDFLACKQESQVWVENNELRFQRAKRNHFDHLPDFTIRWKGQDWKAGDWEV